MNKDSELTRIRTENKVQASGGEEPIERSSELNVNVNVKTTLTAEFDASTLELRADTDTQRQEEHNTILQPSFHSGAAMC